MTIAALTTPELALVESAVRRQPNLIQLMGHMRQRIEARRLAYVFGAGVSHPAGGPLWHELINRLAPLYNDPPSPLPAHSATLVARYIFHRFSKRARATGNKIESIDADTAEVMVFDSWYKKIHDAIYEKVPDDVDEVFRQHSYLRPLAWLVLNSRFCLTLNFDDILDRAAAALANESSNRFRRPHSIWSPQVVDRDDAAVIYHLNGFLPREPGTTRSESVVLTEDSFADAAASSNGEANEYLMSRLFSNTVCVLGASLDDPSLRTAFYVAARRNPSSFHYCILKDEDVTIDNVGEGERYDRFFANMELYNLITIFLSEKEIGAFIKMLAEPIDDFKNHLTQLGNRVGQETVRRYFLVGTVSCGKSSAISRLRTFNAHEEWGRPPPPTMYMDDSQLTPEERERVLEFVLDQLRYKNEWMVNAAYGIAVMDRAPLDLCAFSQSDAENQNKLALLKQRVDPGGLAEGEIIHLEADPAIIEKRQIRRGRGDDWLKNKAYKQQRIAEQNARLRKIYDIDDGDAIDTSKLGMNEVARALAERMLLGDYKPCKLNKRLGDIVNGQKIVDP